MTTLRMALWIGDTCPLYEISSRPLASEAGISNALASSRARDRRSIIASKSASESPSSQNRPLLATFAPSQPPTQRTPEGSSPTSILNRLSGATMTTKRPSSESFAVEAESCRADLSVGCLSWHNHLYAP